MIRYFSFKSCYTVLSYTIQPRAKVRRDVLPSLDDPRMVCRASRRCLRGDGMNTRLACPVPEDSGRFGDLGDGAGTGAPAEKAGHISAASGKGIGCARHAGAGAGKREGMDQI